MKPSFSVLWNSYPPQPVQQFPCTDKDYKGKLAYPNQCAIRTSIALIGAGLSLKNYKDPKCSHGHARGAESLANHLHTALFWPKRDSYSVMERAVKGKRGIIFFKDLVEYDCNHIDLWNGTVTKSGWYPSGEIWFWEL